MNRKKLALSIVAVLCMLSLILVLISCDDGGDDGESTQSTKWTIMMYGAGNNNLDNANNNTSYIVQDVQDMEKVGSQSGMEIIAMVSRYGGGGQAKYYHIERHENENPNQISSTMLEDKGTKDMSDPATLKEFMNYCKDHYPADKYLLIVDDHGAGWPGSCSDELNGGDGLLTMPELKTAISTSNIQHVDIVTFHACLMAMVEVGYELRAVAGYLTASQFTMPMQNVLGADLWLAWLRDNNGASPRDLAQKIAEKVMVAAANKQKTAHYAMIDLSKMDDLGAKIGQLGNILVTEAAEHWDEVVHAWGQTHVTQYDNQAYVDLREFTNKLNAEPTLSGINLISNAATDVRNLLNSDGAVPYTSTNINGTDPNVPRGGLCIHFPPSLELFDSSNYVTLDFRATNWHAFLSTFLRQGGQQEPQGRCCYNNNADCGVGTQAECAGVNGTWTQGIDCNTPCATAAQGRCCYNNNQSCGVGTQAECAGVNGTWTQGIDCNTPCGGAAACPTTCATAATITLGQPVTNCQVATVNGENWFTVVLNPGSYNFQLNNFAQNADFDVYVFVQCADYPNNYSQDCIGVAEGEENFDCTITGGSLQIYLSIYSYAGTGGYTLSVSQTGTPLDDDSNLITKTGSFGDKR